jgi:O-antigen/teichoic acid export membrane protein
VARAARTRSVKAEATHAEPELSAGDIGRRAASGAALLTAKGILAQVLGLVSTIVVARLLLPSQLGLYAIALTISTFLLIFGSGVGMASALIRRPAAPQHADLQAYVAFQLIASVALVVVVILATRPFGLVGQLTSVMILSAPITAFRGAGLVVLERQLLYRRIATAETAETLIYYAWTIVSVTIGWGLWGLATATVARAVVGTAFIVALAPTGVIWPRIYRRRIRAMLGIGLRVQAVELVVALRDQLLVLGTAAIGSVSIVAYWGLILRALQAPQTLLMTLLRVSFPAMSRTRSAGGDPGSMLPRLLAAATILTGTLLAPLAAAPALVPLLFGAKWSPAADALVLTCLAVVIHTPLMIAGQSYLWTAGDAKSPLRASIAEAVVVVAVGLPLVPILGVLGLAIGGVACAAVGTAILARAVDRQTQVHVVRHIRIPVLAWMVAAGAAWGCAQGPGPLLLRTAISSCVAVGLYFGLLLLTRRELTLGLAREYWPLIRRRVLRRGAAPSDDERAGVTSSQPPSESHPRRPASLRKTARDHQADGNTGYLSRDALTQRRLSATRPAVTSRSRSSREPKHDDEAEAHEDQLLR